MIPAPPFPRGLFPFAVVPILLPTIFVPPSTAIPAPALPEIRFPSPGPGPPIVTPSAQTPAAVLATLFVPQYTVRMKLPSRRTPLPRQAPTPHPLPDIRLRTNGVAPPIRLLLNTGEPHRAKNVPE